MHENLAPYFKKHYINNRKLRHAFIKSGLTPNLIARRMGWERKIHNRPTPVGDGQRVRRVLGMVPQKNHKGVFKRRKYVRRDIAKRLCEAMGVDPVDVGL